MGKPEEKSAEAMEVSDRDQLFDEAVRFVVQSGQASTSMLQRRFRDRLLPGRAASWT